MAIFDDVVRVHGERTLTRAPLLGVVETKTLRLVPCTVEPYAMPYVPYTKRCVVCGALYLKGLMDD